MDDISNEENNHGILLKQEKNKAEEKIAPEVITETVTTEGAILAREGISLTSAKLK